MGEEGRVCVCEGGGGGETKSRNDYDLTISICDWGNALERLFFRGYLFSTIPMPALCVCMHVCVHMYVCVRMPVGLCV